MQQWKLCVIPILCALCKGEEFAYVSIAGVGVELTKVLE
jgi:hypothetical protein